MKMVSIECEPNCVEISVIKNKQANTCYNMEYFLYFEIKNRINN